MDFNKEFYGSDITKHSDAHSLLTQEIDKLKNIFTLGGILFFEDTANLYYSSITLDYDTALSAIEAMPNLYPTNYKLVEGTGLSASPSNSLFLRMTPSVHEGINLELWAVLPNLSRDLLAWLQQLGLKATTYSKYQLGNTYYHYSKEINFEDEDLDVATIIDTLDQDFKSLPCTYLYSIFEDFSVAVPVVHSLGKIKEFLHTAEIKFYKYTPKSSDTFWIFRVGIFPKVEIHKVLIDIYIVY